MSDTFTQEYVDEWRELARPLEELTGIKHSGFDPDVLFHYGDRKSVSIPRWLLELINEGLEELKERRND